MFSAMIKDAHILKESIDIISQLIDEGLFKLKRDCIELIATDRAMVAVVDFKLVASAFDDYKCDQETAIGLNLLNFLTILKRAGTEDQLTLKLNEKENKLEIILKGKSTREFAIPLLDISTEEIPPIGQLDFPADAEVRADVIAEGIADADVIADSVFIELSENKLRMLAEGDSSRTELKIEKGSESLTKLDAKGTFKSRYPIDYLKKIIRAGKLVEKVKLQLGTDYPMRLEFIEGAKIKISFVLAPRVSEE